MKMKKIMTNIKLTYRCTYVKILPMLDKYYHNIKSPFYLKEFVVRLIMIL